MDVVFDTKAAGSWDDTQWLSAYPLTVYTVLDYFSNSPFYDLNCNNEKAKRRRPVVPPQEFASLGPGLEFHIDSIQEPHLYVIRKQLRAANLRDVRAVGYYYVFNGRIYQAPSLQSIMTARVARCCQSLADAKDGLAELLGPEVDPAAGGEEEAGAAARASQGGASGAERRAPLDVDLHQKATVFTVWDPSLPPSRFATSDRPQEQSQLLRRYDHAGRIIGRVLQRYHGAALGRYEEASRGAGGESMLGGSALVTGQLSGPEPSLGARQGGAAAGAGDVSRPAKPEPASSAPPPLFSPPVLAAPPPPPLPPPPPPPVNIKLTLPIPPPPPSSTMHPLQPPASGAASGSPAESGRPADSTQFYPLSASAPGAPAASGPAPASQAAAGAARPKPPGGAMKLSLKIGVKRPAEGPPQPP